ncbi:MAG TPA: UDP-N-acetylmuramate dehydrogenase [Actinomycetota bacterium]|nr:UDP-N-acetylmuramate dehydrogenase [Actinomycetota bacterium]
MSDLAAARAILVEAVGPRLREEHPLAPLTTFRIGGPAALYLEPNDEADLRAAHRAIVETGIPVAILGKGSNVLVPDDGFAGLVLRLGRGYRWAARDGDRITAGAAMPLPALAGVAQQHALAGLAFGVAIPASFGGAIRMNAGAHGGQLADVVEEAETFRLRAGDAERRTGEEIGFAYRSTALPADAVVVSATLRLRPGDPAAIREEMEAAREWRRRTQPLAEPNCGSVFVNPPGAHAAALIEAAGLKGLRVGDASVSTKHANFIVAGPDATSQDVLALIEQIRGRILDEDGITLHTEVRMLEPLG